LEMREGEANGLWIPHSQPSSLKSRQIDALDSERYSLTKVPRRYMIRQLDRGHVNVLFTFTLASWPRWGFR